MQKLKKVVLSLCEYQLLIGHREIFPDYYVELRCKFIQASMRIWYIELMLYDMGNIELLTRKIETEHWTKCWSTN